MQNTMDMITPTQILQDDHKKIRGVFRQLMVLDQRAHEMKPGLAEELYLELTIHCDLEEEFLIPDLMEVLNVDGRGVLADIQERHRQIGQTIEELKKTSIDAEDFNRKMGDFRREVELYFEVEERDFFKIAEEKLSTRYEELATTMQARRDEILSDPRNLPGKASRVQNPHGGEQKLKTVA